MGAARTLAVALAICAAVAAAAVGLQAAVLGKPPHRLLVATDILRRLDDFRLVHSTGRIGQHPFHAVCYEGWFMVHGHRTWKAYGAGALLGNGKRVVEAAGKIYVPPAELRLARVELRLACPRVLDTAIAFRLARGTGIVVSRRGRTYVLSFRTRHQHIDYFASTATLSPVGTAVRASWIDGRSHLRAGGLTKREFAKLRLRLTARMGRRWVHPA